MQGQTKETLFQELATSFDSEMESIKLYGGFYIGRYETGNISSEYPVVQRMNTTISGQRWYTIYSRAKNISTNENINTEMIWGCLWDETLQWLIDTNSKTQEEIWSSSRSWGNYNGTAFEYITNISGQTSRKSTDTKLPSGSAERNKANNIYDLAGNVWEYTLEGGNGLGRYYRGGYYYNAGSNGRVCLREYSAPNYNNGFCGYRAYMCIK